MTDRIHLRGVEAFGYHGVLPDEKRDGQLKHLAGRDEVIP